MPSLHELQRGFAAATLLGDGAAGAALGVVPGGLDADTRIGVYRNNILGNYRKVLAATYPVVRRLVGEPFFDAAVDAFGRGHPSRHGDVNRYGGEYAAFLASYPPAGDLAYLPDVARLEWAIDQANIAADAAPLDLGALGGVAPDLLAALRFDLHASAQLVVSAYPILRIWQVNQPAFEGDNHVDLGEGGDTLLVCRNRRGVNIERIGDGECAFLSALAADATLGEAVASAGDVEAAFDLATTLRRHVADQVLVAFRVPATATGEGHT
jgi:hypothetical protein